MRRLLPAVGFLAALAGPSFADPAVTTAWSNMRRAPNGHARVVQGVPENAEIDLQSCSGAWCYASWRNRFGYIPAFAVSGAGPEPPMASAPPPFVEPPPVVASPAWGWSGPYVGVGYGWGWGR